MLAREGFRDGGRALAIADYAYVMENGRVVIDGAGESPKSNPDDMARPTFHMRVSIRLFHVDLRRALPLLYDVLDDAGDLLRGLRS